MPQPAVPAGQRVYAIGDIHGRRDLFEELVALIEADDAARGTAQTTIVLLGDLVDRGPDSASVLEAAMALRNRKPLRVIAGNHEEMLLLAFEKREVLRAFITYGGRETLLSYGLDRDAYNEATLDELQEMLPALIPEHHLAFMRAMENQVRIGDYLFVHAGIRPGVDLELQRLSDLRWIRSEFLEDKRDHGVMVIHGHTITEAVDERANRIGIDTGAYASGVLTAVGLEGTARWYLGTLGDSGLE
ncbi:metallophosphoesterase family protein [Novosphingobium sp.]|uniref:metallophosphoesterase family protein n=1 Tax=Novosphingobium sp. TaxID=1874826 RepID=UPI003452A988